MLFCTPDGGDIAGQMLREHVTMWQKPGTSTSVQVKGLALFVGIQDQLEVPVRKENTAPQPRMCGFPGQSFHASDKLGRYWLRTEPIDKFIIIDSFVTICLNFPRSNHLT